MPLNLFGADANAGSDSESLGGGKIHSGYQVNNNPSSLDFWRVSTDDPDVAAMALEKLEFNPDSDVASALGVDDLNQVIEVGEGDDLRYEVFSGTNKINITIQPGGIGTSLVLWKPDGSGKVAETDGSHLIEEGVVTDQISPLTHGKTLNEIIDIGFKANLRLNFTFSDFPELGSFVLFSGSKTALEHFARREAELTEIDGPVTTTLELEFIKTKRGGYRKPKMGPLTHVEAAETVDNDSNTKEKATPAKKTTRKRNTN